MLAQLYIRRQPHPFRSVLVSSSTAQPSLPHQTSYSLSSLKDKSFKMLSKILPVVAMAAAVNAHGHVATVIADGTEYTGGLPHGAPADAVGWSAANQDNGFVEPNSVGTADIICHKQGTPATNAATVAAGGSVTLQWDTWPVSHHGPVIDYIAPVSGDFGSIDKSSLQFAKIAEAGLNSGNNPGDWASDDLIANVSSVPGDKRRNSC